MGEGSFQAGICSRMHCLVPEAVMKEFGPVLGFELYSQLCSPQHGAQEESALSLSGNQPGFHQLPLILLGSFAVLQKKCSMKHKVPLLLLEVFVQCLKTPQPRGSSLSVSLARGSSGSCTFQSTSLPLPFFPPQGLKKPHVAIQLLYFPSSPCGMTATVLCGMQGLPFGGDQSQC